MSKAFHVPYKPSFFKPLELVPPHVYNAAYELAKALYPAQGMAQQDYVEFVIYSMFEPALLRSIDWLRENYGPCIINNWADGGDFSYRGLRDAGSEYYSPGSMHSLRMDRKVGAADCSFTEISADAIRSDIRRRSYNGELMPFTRIESKVSWIHVDVKETGRDGVYFFNP